MNTIKEHFGKSVDLEKLQLVIVIAILSTGIGIKALTTFLGG